MQDENITLTENNTEETLTEIPVQKEATTAISEQAGATGETKTVNGKNPSTIGKAFIDAAGIVVAAVSVISLLFTFVFRLVGVDGHSMDTTLADGDWLIVMPYYTEPKYGDIIISTKETAAQGNLVKRVIAVAGDEVYVDENDNVYVNGEEINDAGYILTDNNRHGNLTYPVTVPEGCVMLMGDNRTVSWDSRYSEIGFAETDYLLGKAFFRIGKNWNIYSNFPG